MLQPITKKEFDEIYFIMQYSFPQSERRPREKQLALFDDERYKVCVERDYNGKIRAFMAYWGLDGVTFLEHFAVDKSLRGNGIGGKFLDELLSRLSGTVCLEAEPPLCDIAARRIAFYERHGFSLNDYEYVQPPLNDGGESVPLKVMSYPSPLSPVQFEEIRGKIYKAVYKI